jgi:hypothetical protein
MRQRPPASWPLQLLLGGLGLGQNHQAWAQFGCQTQACCAERCAAQGYCCNAVLTNSANQLFSCYQACTMRVAGDPAALVNRRCRDTLPPGSGGSIGCEFDHETLGLLSLCGSCDDNQPPDQWPKCGSNAVNDGDACLAGSGNVWTAGGLLRGILGWLITVLLLLTISGWALIGMVRGSGGWQGHPHYQQTVELASLVKDGIGAWKTTSNAVFLFCHPPVPTFFSFAPFSFMKYDHVHIAKTGSGCTRGKPLKQTRHVCAVFCSSGGKGAGGGYSAVPSAPAALDLAGSAPSGDHEQRVRVKKKPSKQQSKEKGKKKKKEKKEAKRSTSSKGRKGESRATAIISAEQAREREAEAASAAGEGGRLLEQKDGGVHSSQAKITVAIERVAI